ncbi:hypothetical protein HMPREF1203_00723 [Bacteroides fragilis HMW 610]|nr:hypothetical protein HMPREF1203_00723 [Bacteroides fragilis HMW 610]
MELKLPFLLSSSRANEVLIVPYGIETRNVIRDSKEEGVLIVPYGIETHQPIELLIPRNSVNCTLWN